VSERARRGRLVVLLGPSGVGKSSVVRELRAMLPEMYFSVSATTRDMRAGEVDGVDYDFVGPAGFQRLIDAGELLEWAEIHGGLQRSGTRRAPVEAALSQGRPVVVEVDLAGARAMKQAMPEGITVFLAPPSMAELERRLRHRGTETDAAFARRLETAREEMAARDEFDVTVISDEPRAVASRLVELLVARPAHPPRRTTQESSS
jgi:guanylate kinase